MPNIFKQNLADTPHEVLNWRLFVATLTFGLMGAARGLDEGLISGTINQKSFISEFPITPASGISKDESANRIGNITSMVQIGSVGGALIAFILCDKIGRVWATRQLCVIWIIGIIVYITADGRLGQVYAGRFVAGLGIGQTTVVAPTYLAEISPRSVRGLCICAFSGSVYLGIMLGYFANWGTSLHISNSSASQWVIPTSMHIMFAGIIFILTFAVKESPRYLVKVSKQDQAAENLSQIRNLPIDHLYVQNELMDIQEQLAREQQATHNNSILGPLKELFFLPSNRYRFALGLFAQLLSQWSGGSSITIYAPEFFAMLGKTGTSEKLFVTAILGVVKLVAALTCALFLVDVIGRKRSLGIGIVLQFISMLYIAILFTCAPGIQDHPTTQSSAVKHATTGAIVFVYLSGVGWAMGWNSIQYLINAEIFPLRVRSLGTSIIMCLHFVNQYGSSKALPKMLLAMHPNGTFWFFSAVTLIGLLWAWFFLPETAGLSLEAMDEVFELRWFEIGRKGRDVAVRKVEERDAERESRRRSSLAVGVGAEKRWRDSNSSGEGTHVGDVGVGGVDEKDRDGVKERRVEDAVSRV